MQRAAFVAMRLIGLGLGLTGLACDDKAAPTIVDDKTIRWQLSGSSISFKPHQPTEDDDFDVTCSISGGSLDFKIVAPRIADEKRPRSILELRRGNPTAATCIVSVTEAPMEGEGEFRLQDNCKGTVATGGCTLNGSFDTNGWDFEGSLICTKLVQQAGDAEISLFDGVGSRNAVQIKLDNCD